MVASRRSPAATGVAGSFDATYGLRLAGDFGRRRGLPVLGATGAPQTVIIRGMRVRGGAAIRRGTFETQCRRRRSAECQVKYPRARLEAGSCPSAAPRTRKTIAP